jgi:hypothetical protein
MSATGWWSVKGTLGTFGGMEPNVWNATIPNRPVLPIELEHSDMPVLDCPYLNPKNIKA